MAVAMLTDAICDHVSAPSRDRPLVVSIHGPPGVGKSLTHRLVAQALYNDAPNIGMSCPGNDCPGYKLALQSLRAVFILESNQGFLQLHELLQKAGTREAVNAEEAQRVLKDLVFEQWVAQSCEERSDTVKMVRK
ncbi:hypothetical protein H632_c1348p0 [Helicosporidium sp. ATCC 50920]|nr:hypothetical protein H632_c1348p0 [Helicosporidium sp. ATCC 50920]|eukprot:KDD74388.1 hypothetical protein H632_c1348p0 [Helicosporidium sp. ATCC 50920]